MFIRRIVAAAVFVLAGFAVFSGTDVLAAAGQPEPWQTGFQDAASPVMEGIHSFHRLVLFIISGIVVFVLGLMFYIVLRFNEKANPTPRRFTHNTILEIFWTAVPVIILIVIALPSVKLLRLQDDTTDADMVLKVTGYQWHWGYEYPDYGIDFESYLNREEDAEPKLLDTTDSVKVPVDTKIQVLVTSDPNDVIHSWAVPSFGIKMDAIPGKINETWFMAPNEGKYYGQCTELCGTNHAYMPIEIDVVSKEEFEAWVLERGGSLPDAGAAENGAAASNDDAQVAQPAPQNPAPSAGTE